MSTLITLWVVGMLLLLCFGFIIVEEVDSEADWSGPEFAAAWVLWPLVLVVIFLVGTCRLLVRMVKSF